MPTRLCSDCRAQPATYRGRCTNCNRTNQRQHGQRSRLTKAQQRRIYNSARWKHTRAHVLHQQPLCPGVFGQPCGHVAEEVDHITPLIDGGDAYLLSNLQGLCRPCHFAKTRNERYGRLATNDPLIVIIGPPGSGKTELRQQLGPLLAINTAGPDDTPDRWDTVHHTASTGPCIVECCKPTRQLRDLMNARPTRTILLTAPEPVRRQRLKQRDLPPDQIAELLTQTHPTYPDQPPLRHYETYDTSTATARELARHLALTQGQGEGRPAQP